MLFELLEEYKHVGGNELLIIIEKVIKDINGKEALTSTIRKSNSFKDPQAHIQFLWRDKKNA